MSKGKFQVLPMKKDAYKSFKIKKNKLFDMPFRIGIVGKSELSCGKTTIICNFLLRDNFYKNMFDPENIYIICGSSNIDEKWSTLIEQLEIPDSNICMKYDEEYLEVLYDMIKDEFLEAINNNEKPKHHLVIFDDISFDGCLKKKQYGVISKMLSNGRHILLSSIQTAQKYTTLSTNSRENFTGLILGECTNKQVEAIYEDHGYLHKKGFIQMFRDSTSEPYSFCVINYTNPKKERYLNKDFETIDVSKYEK